VRAVRILSALVDIAAYYISLQTITKMGPEPSCFEKLLYNFIRLRLSRFKLTRLLTLQETGGYDICTVDHISRCYRYLTFNRDKLKYSTGGQTRLLGISKRGDSSLRTLLIHGARATRRWARTKADRRSQWIRGLLAAARPLGVPPGSRPSARGRRPRLYDALSREAVSRGPRLPAHPGDDRVWTDPRP
jgi:hypothetical protein